MQRLRNLFVTLALVATAFGAQAGTEAGFAITRDYGALITAGALNAAPVLSVTGLGKHYRTVKLQIDFTRHLATTVTLACTESSDAAATQASIMVLDPTSGNITPLPTITWTTSVTGNISLPISVAGDNSLVCTFGGASADGTDLVTVTATAVVGL